MPRRRLRDISPRVHRRPVLIGLATALAYPLWPAEVLSATAEQASSFIAELTAEVLAALASGESADRREERIRKVLRRGLDLDFMGRFVLGHYWQEATPQQQAAYRDAFADFIIRTYTHRLADRSFTSFTVTSVRQAENGDVVVEERAFRPDGPPVNYGFRVRDTRNALKVIDVSVEEASMLLTQRLDFMSAVEKQGLDGLIEAIRKKTSGR